MSYLPSGTHGTGLDILTGVSSHDSPPEVVLKQRQGAKSTRMAGKPGCVGPLEELRADRDRNKQATLGTTTRIRVSL